MMMNLFSIFDPSTSIYFSLNWISSMYVLLFLPNMFWIIPSRWNYFFIILLNYMINELTNLLNNKMNLFNMIMFISIFTMIMFNNLMGMFSYIFTSSSHLVFSLSMSMLLWISMMLFGWINNMNHMFIHLVPQGTPSILMPFMVLIESISNIIRPMTLAIRLSANIIAGHLLMTLISSICNKLNFIMLILLLLSQCLLVSLELGVSIIQAYVFTVLNSLYSSETN